MFFKIVAKAMRGFAFSLAAMAPVIVQAAAPAEGDRMNNAWEDLVETEGSLLGNAQFTELTHLAYQTAAVRVCDSHSLDQAKIGAALEGILNGEVSPNLTPAQQDERTAAVLIAFGARYGLFLAEAHADTSVFCQSALKLKESGGSVPLFLK